MRADLGLGFGKIGEISRGGEDPERENILVCEMEGLCVFFCFCVIRVGAEREKCRERERGEDDLRRGSSRYKHCCGVYNVSSRSAFHASNARVLY